MFRNSVEVSAFWMFTLMREPDQLRRVVQELLQIVNEGRIKPIIGGVDPLQRATDAIEALESRASHGKLLRKP